MGMKSSNILSLLAMGMMMEGLDTSPFSNNDKTRIRDIDFTPAIAPPAKGCKEYFFNKNGGFSTSSMRKDETVFYCHASNNKCASKKFNKWLKNESSK